MIDPKDNGTAEMLSKPAKRGRPATGKAMTQAERKHASLYRSEADGVLDFPAMSKTRLVAMITMPHPVASVNQFCQFNALAELARRAGLEVVGSGAASVVIRLPQNKA